MGALSSVRLDLVSEAADTLHMRIRLGLLVVVVVVVGPVLASPAVLVTVSRRALGRCHHSRRWPVIASPDGGAAVRRRRSCRGADRLGSGQALLGEPPG